MNQEQAKRITDPNGSFAKDDPTRLRAEGYLLAIEQMRPLVEALEKLIHEIELPGLAHNEIIYVLGKSREAIARWNEGQK